MGGRKENYAGASAESKPQNITGRTWSLRIPRNLDRGDRVLSPASPKSQRNRQAQRHEQEIASGPKPGLVPDRQRPFNDERISQQPKQRTGVRKCIKTIRRRQNLA